MRNKKVWIIILSVFFLFLLGTGIYTLSFKENCSIDLGDWNILLPYVNSCDFGENKQEFKATIYKITETEDQYILDLNIWDKNTDIYIKNVPLDKSNGSFDMNLSENNNYTVILKTNFVSDSELFKLLPLTKSYSLKNWSISEYLPTKEELKKSISTIYSAISNTPYKSLAEDQENANQIIKNIDENNNKVEFTYSNSYDNESVYNPWIESYLRQNNDFTKIKDPLVALDSILKLKNEDLLSCDDCRLTNDYIANNVYTCLLLKDMLENNIPIEKNTLIGLCNEESVLASLTKEKAFEQNTNYEELLDVLDISRLASIEDNQTDVFPRSNYISLLADVASLEYLYGTKITDADLEFALTVITTNTITPEDTNLENACSIAYSLSNIGSLDTFKDNYLSNLKSSILSYETTYSKMFYDNPYAFSLCYEAYSQDSEMKDFNNLILNKFEYLNIFNDDTKVGFWKNNSYELRDNARLAKILLMRYEEI